MESRTQEARLQATFMFVDVAGFTALTEVHGDDAAADLIDRLTQLIRQCIDHHPGATLLEVVGDAALILCPEPRRAIEMIGALLTGAAGESHFPILRAGLHHGWITPRNGRYYGTTLNVTARVAARARGGQVLCTAEVAAAANAAGVTARSLGRHELRNLSEPVELFELCVGPAADEAVIDPVCRMRITRQVAAGSLRHDGRDYWFCSLGCAESFAARPDLYASAT
jgi:class 3 adenylate cyclase/YHS domain-containing protein